MKQFTKITTEYTDEVFEWLIQKPLRLAVLIVACSRARRSKSKVNNLEEGEFYLSQERPEIFGLEPSQAGQLTRVIGELISVGLIEKIETKTGRKGSRVYRVIQGDIVSWTDTRESETETKQKPDRGDTETKQKGTKSVKSVKSVKNDKSDKNIYIGVVEVVNSITQKKRKAVLPKMKKQVDALLDEGYTLEDIRKATLNASKSQFHIKSDYTYLTAEFITRPDKFDNYFNSNPDLSVKAFDYINETSQKYLSKPLRAKFASEEEVSRQIIQVFNGANLDIRRGIEETFKKISHDSKARVNFLEDLLGECKVFVQQKSKLMGKDYGNNIQN